MLRRKAFQSTLAELRQNDNLWNSLGGSQVNLCSRVVLRVLILCPRGRSKAPLGFSCGKPSATSKTKNHQGLRPFGFLALGLASGLASGPASDLALGLLSENHLGGLQCTLRA